MRKTRGRGGEATRKGRGTEDSDAAYAATLRVIEQHSAQVMRTARRYAATREDAEDAYQRAVEIMLTKAPDIPDGELLPWLKTVVRHEAFAIRRQQERFSLGAEDSFNGDGEGQAPSTGQTSSPNEQVERFERLRIGAEALGQLKPQEARAMRLLAQGYSYKQICEKTGWSYTKVNRCLAEGRSSFSEQVASIESGAECERLQPKLSALVDGEAAPEDVARLRQHLRCCLACRVVMREQHLAPAVVGALVPHTLIASTMRVPDRVAELAEAVKLKFAALSRIVGLHSGSGSSQVAMEGGSRGLASIGAAKGLVLICLGGAGAGGAACIAHEIGGRELGSASAATEEAAPNYRPTGRAPKSPDHHLVLERLRARGEYVHAPSSPSTHPEQRFKPHPDRNRRVILEASQPAGSSSPPIEQRVHPTPSSSRLGGARDATSPNDANPPPTDSTNNRWEAGDPDTHSPGDADRDTYGGYEPSRDPYGGYEPSRDPYAGYDPSNEVYGGYQPSE